MNRNLNNKYFIKNLVSPIVDDSPQVINGKGKK